MLIHAHTRTFSLNHFWNPGVEKGLEMSKTRKSKFGTITKLRDSGARMANERGEEKESVHEGST